MQTYIRLVLNILFPLVLLFTVLSIGYFIFDYNFSKAFQLGILSGVLIGVSISLPLALVLLILNAIQKSKINQDKEVTVSPAPLETKSTEHTEIIETPIITKQIKKNHLSQEIKCMLLMERELTFNVILHALKNNSTCTLEKSDPQKGTMSIQTPKGIIQTSITSLTQHTSQIILQATDNITHLKYLMSKIKEKEHAFLEY